MNMLTTWTIVVLCGACCAMASCTARDADPPQNYGDAELEKLYDRHRRYQLDPKRSMIGVDPYAFYMLVKRVESNEGFFRERVLEDFATAELILGHSYLADKYAGLLQTVDKEVRKKVWLEILSSSPPNLPPDSRPVREIGLSELYARHREHIQAQLLNRKVKRISPDANAADELSKRVESNKEFFCARVFEDFFIAEFILRNSDLAKKHSEFLQTVGAEVRKRVWLEILSSSPPNLPPDLRPVRELALSELYARHREYIQAQQAQWLNRKLRWISPDETVVDELLKRLESNKGFFRARVFEDFFVAEFILARSDLAKKHSERIDAADEWMRDKVWLEILSPSPPGSANPK